MRWFTATGLYLLALYTVPLAPRWTAAAGTPPDTSLSKEVLADGIYLFRAPSALDIWTATNVVVIVNEQDVTVFDSNTRPRTARMVIAEIRKITPKPVRTLINSHWHQDRWSGNDEYVRAFPGLQIIATTQTRDYMTRMGSRFFADGLKGAETAAFAAEVAAIPRVYPTIAYSDSLALWSGRREFRLISVTGDATGSTVLYLPADKILVMGDALVTQEEGNGPPPFHDKAYLELTADLFDAIISQVHAALERGLVTLSDVQAVVNVDSIGRQYTPNASEPDPRFRQLVSALVRKVHPESFDGVSRP